MQIWAPPERDGGQKITLLIIAVVGLAMALTMGGTLLIMTLKLPVLEWTLLLTVLVCALCVALALRLRRRFRRATLVFCLDRARRLYYVDAMDFAGYSRGAAGFAAMNARAQRAVRSLTRPDGVLERRMRLPDGLDGFAHEILAVERLREGAAGCTAVCRVRHPNGGESRQKLFVVRGYELGERLINELERLCPPTD